MGLKVLKGCKLLPLLSSRAQEIFADAWSWPHESEREWWRLWQSLSHSAQIIFAKQRLKFSTDIPLLKKKKKSENGF